MADIIFYEKPGCINGEKQKAILRAAGHTLQCLNILKQTWSHNRLGEFMAGKTATEMMNHTAPAIKNGEIVPEQLSASQALDLMVKEPILIKRPLIEVDGHKIQGFNDARLAPYLGDWHGREDVVTCPNLQILSCDERRA
ncbi:MAG: hypothetical protein C0613_07910 [Desulfobulbaceae bacterium]|nr:MAG: hypothetical protein C0613_07910 [Desulfobulbaceae bacterium]